MDDTVVNRLKNELVQAIAAAVSSDPNVEACRAKARAAGSRYISRWRQRWGLPAVETGRSALRRSRRPSAAVRQAGPNRRAREISANDRLFLKSLRIAPDEIPEVKS